MISEKKQIIATSTERTFELVEQVYCVTEHGDEVMIPSGTIFRLSETVVHHVPVENSDND